MNRSVLDGTRRPAVLIDPTLDILAIPHLAHGERNDWCWEVASRNDLVDALAGDAAEHLSDLGSANEVVHADDHRQQPTRHLTSGQSMRKGTRHVPRARRVTSAGS